ncbi:hypothetical protein ACQKQD_24105 [Methylobacterium sp. NPDC080182]|uniref:hypothetical protein n=1 Tax=Methylobacterium sp. NPDC080182 TaxID=3390590 RepID=UPI003CFD3748
MIQVLAAAACAITLLSVSPITDQAAAASAPRIGMYCTDYGYGVPITVRPGRQVGIDGLDCSGATISQGRIRAPKCYANGGSVVTLDELFTVEDDGSIRFNNRIYRYIGIRKTFQDCPGSPRFR